MSDRAAQTCIYRVITVDGSTDKYTQLNTDPKAKKGWLAGWWVAIKSITPNDRPSFGRSVMISAYALW